MWEARGGTLLACDGATTLLRLLQLPGPPCSGLLDGGEGPSLHTVPLKWKPYSSNHTMQMGEYSSTVQEAHSSFSHFK